MFLKRIQVPDFRVLKDVDLTFESEFSPRIFPLGSLNGGGKSTLLQLIFVLLSCASDPDKHIFIQNMLDGFEIEEEKTQKLLTKIYLFDPKNNQNIELHFICHQNKILLDKNDNKDETEKLSSAIIEFSMLGLDKKIEQEISELKNKIIDLRQKYVRVNQILEIKDIEQRRKIIEKEINDIKYGTLGSFIRNFFKIKRNTTNDTEIDLLNLQSLSEEFLRRGGEIETCLEEKKIEQENIKIFQNKISSYLKNQNLTYICNFYTNDSNTKPEYALLCKSEQLDVSEIDNLLKQLASKIFLAAPFTQVFLFLPKERTKLLFKEHNHKTSYYSTLEETKRKLPNLFTYDILSVDYIIEFFKAARDKDFQQAIETGKYGDTYQSVLQALNSILVNKKINIDTDLSGVNFKIDKDGVAQELYPEDLSHGELKRLSIYVWLKYKNIQDSLVLMDEVENAFHPDWQYRIISDLAEWGASNQYILATHSYELCQALTPAHVKELEPKLPQLLGEKQVEN